MAGKANETCKQCKQFRMLCMCPRDGGSDVVQGESKKGPVLKMRGATLQSLAIYAAALKRRSRKKASGQNVTGRQPLQSVVSTQGSADI
jgi:hypothetical protein